MYFRLQKPLARTAASGSAVRRAVRGFQAKTQPHSTTWRGLKGFVLLASEGRILRPTTGRYGDGTAA